MKRRDILALALGTLGGAAAHGDERPRKHLHLVTADLPPLVMAPGGERPGALRELVDALCARLDMRADVAFVPWRRALYLATTMKQTAIFPLTRLPSREAQFCWLAPLYEENYIFMAPHGSGFDVQQPQQGTGKRIALLRGAAQSAILKELGFERLVEATSIDEVHRFLMAGMADAVFGERAIIRSSLMARADEKQFRLSAPVRTTSAWLAGSLDFSEGDAQRYSQAMAALVADGTQRRILARYGLM